MYVLRHLLLVLSIIVPSASSVRAQTPAVALSSYTCADFLRDTKEPADGVKLLRSLMMIAWAAGYTAAHQEGTPRADPAAIQLVSATLGDACRRSSGLLAVRAISEAIEQLAQSGASTAPPSRTEIPTPVTAVDQENSKLVTGVLVPNPHAVPNGSFSTYDNFDMFGGDLRKIPKIELKACVAACQADRQCSGYSFDRWNRYCYLKSTISALTFDPSSTAGLRAQGVPEFSKAEYRIDRRANKSLEGSSSVKIGISGVEDCDRNCAADKTCFGFTFEKPRGVCRAFSAISTFKPDRSATSGIKTQSPP